MEAREICLGKDTKPLTRLLSVRYNVHRFVKKRKKQKTMNTKTTIPISEARKKIFTIAKEIQKPGRYYTFTEKGRPKAVMMSAEEFESWQETLEIIEKFPQLEENIKEAEKDYKKGDYITLEELLKKEGYVPRDKGKEKHEVSARYTKGSSKRIKKDR